MPSQVTLAPGRCLGWVLSLTAAPRGLRAPLTGSRQPRLPGLGGGSCGALHCRPPAASLRCGPAWVPADGQRLLCPGLPVLGPRSRSAPCAQLGPAPSPAGTPCKQPPATCTETGPVLRTLLHCKGCGDRSPPASRHPGKPTHAGVASRATAGLQPPVPGRVPGLSVLAVGCCVCVIEAGSCSEAAGLSTTPGHRHVPARRRQGTGTGCQGRHGRAWVSPPAPAMPCGGESLAVTSGDKAPYGDGEGRRLATARGWLGEGAGGGGPPAPASGGFCMFSCSHLPGLTFSGSASRVSQRPVAARPLWSPAMRRKTPRPGARLPGWGPGGSSHFTLFREYEFTRKSRGWAPSWPPGPPAVETGSRSCTKWERGGGRGPEQPARGVAGRAFRWDSAGQESWGCRNLLKTLRLFFPRSKTAVGRCSQTKRVWGILPRRRRPAGSGGCGAGGVRGMAVPAWTWR